MHSREFEYTNKDYEYSDSELEENKTVATTFTFNSDLSGEVHISRHYFDEASWDSIDGIKVPGWMLLEFVGDHVRGEIIDKLEQQKGREVLGLEVRNDES